jgi:uncharacterized RDD family membrane protein YckC
MMDTGQMYGSSSASKDYAGFWLRLVAHLIDGLILGIINIPVTIVVWIIAAGIAESSKHNGSDQTATFFAYLVLNIIAFFISFAILIVYHAAFECTKQASPGKMALGLMVTDMSGNRLTFLHALGRNAGKFVSSITLCVGFILCGFTQQKQCLHDMMAGTLVVRKPR